MKLTFEKRLMKLTFKLQNDLAAQAVITALADAARNSYANWGDYGNEAVDAMTTGKYFRTWSGKGLYQVHHLMLIFNGYHGSLINGVNNFVIESDGRGGYQFRTWAEGTTVVLPLQLIHRETSLGKIL
jgi:hypothetical protein